MALQKKSDNWIWKHVLKLNDSIIQCNVDDCKKIYTMTNKGEYRVIMTMKGHLYHEHGKYDEQDRLKWLNDNDLIWRYFDKANLYVANCKLCGGLFRQSYVPLIKTHLQSHRQEIRDGVEKEIADKSLSQNYVIDMDEFIARCKRCNDKMDIFYGTDALIHHVCLKKNKCLWSEDNNVNRMIQQSTATENANTSSHHDDINSQPGNRENQQSDTSRHCVDVMAARERSNNWVWKHLLKLDDFTVQCNIDNCNKTYNTTLDRSKGRMIVIIKGHLYHEHGKYDEEDRLKWENDNDLIWRYFDKEGLYKEKCKFCYDSLSISYTPSLRDHLRQYHRKKIRAGVRKEIADKSLSQYFEIHKKEFNASCKRCNHKMDIFYGIDALTHHICLKKNQRLRFGKKSEDNNMNRMTQQSTVTENANTSSHHDDINSQPENRENQQSDTLGHYVDEMSARETNNWVWKHLLKVNDSSVQCNIDNCDKTYTTFDRNKGRLMMMIKGHLYHEHEKYDEEDRLKWENDNDLIWRYFDKVGLYKEKCKFCKDTLLVSYTPSLRHHLLKYHHQKIRAGVLKEIADKSLSQYFEIHEKEFSARCKCCNVEKNIFFGTDALIHHMQKNRCVGYHNEDDNVNRMTQQSITDENTSSHHDNLNKQVLGNREDRQSDTSRCTDIMAALKGSNSWVWNHVLKLDNFTVQCNIDGCDQIYINRNRKFINRMITTIKEHLYHKHEICNEEDRSKWVNNNDLIWRYFDKVDLYKEKCKFCNISLHQAHIPFIKKHLQKHRQEIITIVRKEIANKSLSQDFEIDEKEFSALCKYCNVKKNIFYGTDVLKHICLKKKQRLMSRQEPEDNDVNRMTQPRIQQSIATENVITNSHHDDINRQTPRNQERYVKEAADENAITSSHHDDINRQAPRNQDQQRNEEGAADENAITNFHHDDINRQALRNQDQQNSEGINIDDTVQFLDYNQESTYCYILGNQDGPQSSEENNTDNIVFLAHDVSNASSHYDGTNWQDLGYQINQQRMMHQSVAAVNMATSYHDESTFCSEENNTSNIVFLAHDVSDVSSHNDGTNWQGLGYQIDQQSSEGNNTNSIVFLAHDVSDVSSHNDGTNWQGLRYQIDQQRYVNQQSSEENNTNNIVFLAHDVSDVSSHNDGTNWQGLRYQIDQQSTEENNTSNIVFLAHDVSDVSSHNDGTNWQGFGYQIDQQSSEGNNTNSIVFLAHDVSDVSSPYDGTNWQILGCQEDQQRMMHQFVAAGNVATNFHNDDTNWQAVGYLVDEQRMMHQFVAAENVTTSSHNDTTLQAPGNQENQ
ncbi:PREDICTED: putative uncharacterized protein DDB_G0282133 isoform X2 [Acromyrmex echinatior]|uniref:putative uncharacterized protein DDB_G0282133 isoform X2 n=1 Tax=Acromyrmex echinatior TaxID=103372 RepID=UPI000580F62A|nr:PREDICTED: putative uncharacterized protein DDB_G0282133 isoform X2 [Acromyrmex echinatior]